MAPGGGGESSIHDEALLSMAALFGSFGCRSVRAMVARNQEHHHPEVAYGTS
jgi:hypothetical protein